MVAGLHARPLFTVAANLRYHVDQESGRVDGRVEATQRLKPTRRPSRRHVDALRT